MHRFLIISAFIGGAIINSFGQINHKKVFGTVKIDNTTSMKSTEVTLQEWLGFIVNNNFDNSLFPDNEYISAPAKMLFDDLKKRDGCEYFTIVHNTGNMRNNFGEKAVHPTKAFHTLTKTITTHFSLNDPIVGITFEQAQLFCKWKETIINRSRDTKITIGLPPVEIYVKVIANTDSLCKSKCDSCHGYLFNYSHASCNVKDKHNDLATQGQGLLRADSYWPTVLGLYCLQGNAAEMTSTKGIAMGGSFRHSARQSYNDQRQTYTKAEDWLGFRYIVTANY